MFHLKWHFHGLKGLHFHQNLLHHQLEVVAVVQEPIQHLINQKILFHSF
jgi:hypothetical protein